ncbi:MAG: hypothetical protein FWC75_04050 [Oscillospiraceae bacterium]|nr:hypothetical protein [Oscillospiraceae bacterium]
MFADAVPDEEMAVVIADTVLIAMGENGILSPIPLSTGRFCTIARDVIDLDPSEVTYFSYVIDATFSRLRRAWIIRGEFPDPPEGYAAIMGWVPEVTIRMRDARIISVRFR